jgi:dihydrofolate synthase/folylpolyglutamate synthase
MSQAVKALYKRTTQGIKPGLEVIEALMQTLGNPHRNLAIIHVAGTNGKGSVCAMLESVLRASGFKTGLYTSPHLINFTERFRINGVEMSPDKLDDYIWLMEEKAAEVERCTGKRPATFFEISTAIAFQYFADQEVDIAIIETGMGGRWDATNVVIPLVSVITHIDMDHMEFLGDSIEAVAAEKAGIIKSDRPVVSAPQSEEVMAVLRSSGEPIILAAESVSVRKVDEPNRIKIETQSRCTERICLPLLGECQRENCAVAVAVLELLVDMLAFEPKYKKGLERVQWASRFEQLSLHPPIYLDGAHNPSAARALMKTLKENFPKHQVGFVLGFLDDKEQVEFIRILKQRVDKAWAVPIDAMRGTTAKQTAANAKAAGVDAIPLDVEGAMDEARAWASAEPDRVVIITGSLYLKQMLTAAGCA